MLAVAVQSALGLVFPKSCEICHKPLALSKLEAVCLSCRSSIAFLSVDDARKNLPENSFFFDRVFACTAYQGVVRDMIHRYKFENKKYLSHFFSDLMLNFLRNLESPPFFDGICAVPLDWDKFRERGFNQSGLLAKALAKNLGVADLSTYLKRQSTPSEQFRLGKSQRKDNVKGIFKVKDREPFKDRHLLLVDDILTTGHTASECSKTLKNAGAKSVAVLALSRGIL